LRREVWTFWTGKEKVGSISIEPKTVVPIGQSDESKRGKLRLAKIRQGGGGRYMGWGDNWDFLSPPREDIERSN